MGKPSMEMKYRECEITFYIKIVVEAVSVFLGTRRIKAPIFFQMFFTIIAFNLE